MGCMFGLVMFCCSLLKIIYIELELLFLVYNGVSFIMNCYILNPDECIFSKEKKVR